MKSIVEEALSRAREEQRFSEPTEIDKELEDILIELRTEIAVVGCGGRRFEHGHTDVGGRYQRGAVNCPQHRRPAPHQD